MEDKMNDMKHGKHECCMNKAENKEGSKNNMKQYIMLAAVGLLLIAVVVQSFQISALKARPAAASGITGNAVDMSGWTENEKMNYEHHGTLPARVQGGAPAPSAMVGGC